MGGTLSKFTPVLHVVEKEFDFFFGKK